LGYNEPMKTVRERIQDYIRSHRAVTATELSQAFQMTPANARHHLATLTKQGLLQVVDDRAASNRGRPAHIFTTSEQAMGDNLDLLAGILLEQIAKQTDPQQLDGVLQQLANELASRMAARVDLLAVSIRSGENLTQRLYRATEILNRHHYEARWEARPDAPRMVLGHCPFYAILNEHPEICQLDAQLIERFTGASVEQISKLAKDPAGLRFCLFRIGKERV
jgi:predicted ArsR family transcriptional regulator